jgi:hypothetical protein
MAPDQPECRLHGRGNIRTEIDPERVRPELPVGHNQLDPALGVLGVAERNRYSEEKHEDRE